MARWVLEWGQITQFGQIGSCAHLEIWEQVLAPCTPHEQKEDEGGQPKENLGIVIKRKGYGCWAGKTKSYLLYKALLLLAL